MKLRLIVVLIISFVKHTSLAQTLNFIPIPDTLSGSEMNLNVHAGTANFFLGEASQTIGINQYNYLGPTLLLQKGSNLSLVVTNNIGDTTNLHWHGLQVPPIYDGPTTHILDNETWNPVFNVVNRAGTYWYHPHLHKKTASQALKGACGMIIVRDEEEAQLNLPRDYGKDDFPIIIQSIQYDSLNQCLPRGMQDSTIFVNGVRANYDNEAALNLPSQVVRLRLLNASGERTFNFGFSNNFPFYVIASDGGLLSNPYSTNRIRISPGERYEIIVDLTGLGGGELFLKSYASELPVGVQGGPTMVMPIGSPPMDSPLNGIDFNILHLFVVQQTLNPVLSIPNVLSTWSTYNESESLLQRNIQMTAQSMMSMDGPFYFNNLLFDMDRIDFVIPINNIEIWQLTNQTMVAHPFHMHGVEFTILSRDGNLPSPAERGMKDVVLVESMETVRVIAKFDFYTDTVVPYVYHCHILMHEDDGMMGQFLVAPEGYVGTNYLFEKSKLFSVTPNPTCDEINLNLAEIVNGNFDIKICDLLGNVVLQQNNSFCKKLEVSDLKTGEYLVFIRKGNKYYNSRFIKS